jgi:hypothetical protein
MPTLTTIRSSIVRLSTGKNLGWLLLSVLIATPVAAHTVKVSGDVAATFHIEPEHNPKAGQPSLAWFALTRKGGRLIPLAQCDCKLAVYLEPQKEGSQSLMQPTLKPVAAEQYQGIPGADIKFPQAGIYQMELSGKPRAGANFQPFVLTYEITVQPGGASESPHPETQPRNSSGMDEMQHQHH